MFGSKQFLERFHLQVIVLLVLLIGSIFLTLNRHNRNHIQTYQSEIWADRAGYHVYLPALFIYGFDARAMPDSIDKKTGHGFVNTDEGKISTKYTCGVAMLQAPFFLVAHMMTSQLGYADDGFSLPYHKAIDIAAVFYGLLGLVILYRYLLLEFSIVVAYLTCTLVFAGTGVFYYMFIDAGMSHIYSFALMSGLMYVTRRCSNDGYDRKSIMISAVLVALIVLVRPINLLLVAVIVPFIPWRVLWSDHRYALVASAIIGILIVVPQLLYWQYQTGEVLTYSYGSEGFSNWRGPKILEIWFAPHNGLLTYAPVFGMCLVGIALMFRKQPTQAIVIALHFGLVSYVFASWWSWTYGCGFGSRPYVEYMAIMAMPLGHVVHFTVHSRSINFRSALFILMAILILWTQKLIFSYGHCWFWNDWDWSAFGKLLFGPTK